MNSGVLESDRSSPHQNPPLQSYHSSPCSSANSLTGAGTADAHTTAFHRTLKREIIAQELQQRLMRSNGNLLL